MYSNKHPLVLSVHHMEDGTNSMHHIELYQICKG